MAKLKSTYVIGGLTVEGPIIASQYVTLGGEGNVTVASNITGNADVIPKFQTDGAFSVVKSTISDMVVSGEASHLRLGNTGGMDPVVLEFWRGSTASSWDIRNVGGNLLFRNNYTAAAGDYFDVLTLDYSTGNATIKGSLSVGGATVVSSTGQIAAGQLSGEIPTTVTQTEWDTAYADTSGATSANTASKIVKRDASGNFSAGTITASLTGNASSATKLGSSDVGSGTVPMYLSAGAPTASTSNVGSGIIPMHLSSGTLTASTSTVGSDIIPMHLSSGTLTASTSTVGGTTTPIYLKAGTITAGTALGTAAYVSADQNLNTTSSPTFNSIYSRIAPMLPAVDTTTYALTTTALNSFSPATVASYYNTAAGYRALYYLDPTSIANGIYNSAFGSESLYTCSTGGYNNAFGYRSLYTCNSSYNNAFGYMSLYTCSTGADNSAFGSESLRSCSSGGRNSAFGNESLRGCLTGSYNSAFGYASLRGHTYGSYNSAFGYWSGTSISTQSYCLCLGSSTNINTSAGDYQMNFNNRVRYFEFPKETTHGTIYSTVSTYLGSNSNDGVGAIGRYGNLSVNLIWRASSTEIRFQESGGSSRLAVVSGSGTKTTENLKILFLAGA